MLEEFFFFQVREHKEILSFLFSLKKYIDSDRNQAC